MYCLDGFLQQLLDACRRNVASTTRYFFRPFKYNQDTLFTYIIYLLFAAYQSQPAYKVLDLQTQH